MWKFKQMNISPIEQLHAAIEWLAMPEHYFQLLMVAGVFLLVIVLVKYTRCKIMFLSEPSADINPFSLTWFMRRSGRLLYPVSAMFFLAMAELVSHHLFDEKIVVNAVQRVVIVWFLWVLLKVFVTNIVVRRIAMWLLVPAALLQLFGLFEAVVRQLSAYGITIGDVEITAYTVMKGVFYVSVVFWLGRVFSQSGERYIRNNTSINRTTKELLIKLFDIVLYTILFLVTLNLVGIDLTALAVFGGALGVGIGFGLQKVASNFISGLILLTEKSINIGNLIEMNDGIYGYVRKLGARASIIETFDGKEVMVPNEDFITSRVSNLTYSNTYGRVDIVVGVDYDTDLDLAHKLILEAAEEFEDAVKGDIDHSPKCYLREFGDSSVNFLLVFWLQDITEGRWGAQSDVMFTIWRKLKANNIAIPFPQRDLHIRSGLEALIEKPKDSSKNT